MSDRLKDSIFRYYGVHDAPAIVCQSIENYYDVAIDNNCSHKEIVEYLPESVIVLFVSLTVNTSQDRALAFSKLIEMKFGLCCDTIIDQRIQLGSSIIRTGAVIVAHTQLSNLLKLLFALSNHAFAVLMDEGKIGTLSNHLVQLFQPGILTPQILAECCNTALLHKASFLHVLRGCDGYTVNHLSMNQ